MRHATKKWGDTPGERAHSERNEQAHAEEQRLERERVTPRDEPLRLSDLMHGTGGYIDTHAPWSHVRDIIRREMFRFRHYAKRESHIASYDKLPFSNEQLAAFGLVADAIGGVMDIIKDKEDDDECIHPRGKE